MERQTTLEEKKKTEPVNIYVHFQKQINAMSIVWIASEKSANHLPILLWSLQY